MPRRVSTGDNWTKAGRLQGTDLHTRVRDLDWSPIGRSSDSHPIRRGTVLRDMGRQVLVGNPVSEGLRLAELGVPVAWRSS